MAHLLLSHCTVETSGNVLRSTIIVCAAFFMFILLPADVSSQSVCALPNNTGYEFGALPSLGLPDLGLPDLGLPVLGTTVSGLGGVTCAEGFAGEPAVSCNASSGTGGGSTDTSTMTVIVGDFKWNYGALAADGKIYGIPFNAEAVLIIDPMAGTTDTSTMAVGPEPGKWAGGVLATDGKIYGIPAGAESVLIIDPIAGTTDTSMMTVGPGLNKWNGGVLSADGKIYGIPRDAESVLIIDPMAGTTNISTMAGLTGSSKWNFGALAADGKIYGIPFNAEAVLIIDPMAGTTDTSTMAVGPEPGKWAGGVLATDGKIYGIPAGAESVLIIDPIAGTTDTSMMTVGPGLNKWNGGVLSADGKIYGIPRDAESVLIIDPMAGTTNISTMAGLTGSSKWNYGALAADGKIYGIPFNAEAVLIIDTPEVLPITLTGCEHSIICTQPASITGYVVTETQLDASQGFAVAVACDSGYAGINPLAGACLTPGDYTLSGCEGCQVGQYAAAGASSCSDCSSGQFTAAALARECTDCMPGTYAQGVGNIQCSDCEPGTHAAEWQTSVCSSCSPGQYSPVARARRCLDCSAGQYAADTASTCEDCDTGTADLDSDSSTPCEPCPAGMDAVPGATVCRVIVSANGTDCADNVAIDWREQCTSCLDANDTSCLKEAFQEPAMGCWSLPNVTYAVANLSEVCTCVDTTGLAEGMEELYENQTACEGNDLNLILQWECSLPTCGDNTCDHVNDGECDEGIFCEMGTDCIDCGNCCEIPLCGVNSCEFSDDGQCDDGSNGGTQPMCQPSTDCADCGSCCPMYIDPSCVEKCVGYLDDMFCEVVATGLMVLDMDYSAIQDDPTFKPQCEMWMRELTNMSSTLVEVNSVIPGSVGVEFSVRSSGALSQIADTPVPGTVALETLQVALAGGSTFRATTAIDFVANMCSPGFKSTPGGFFATCDSEADTCADGCTATAASPAIMCTFVAPSTASDCPVGCTFAGEISGNPLVATCTETAAAGSPEIIEACNPDPAFDPALPQPDCTSYVAGDQASCEATTGCIYTASVAAVPAGSNSIQADADACESVDADAADGLSACTAITTVANSTIIACTYTAAGSITPAAAASCGDNVAEVHATCTGTSTAINPAGSPCTQCEAGYFGDGSESFCSPCPEGRFSNVEAATCTDCTVGRFAPVQGSAACTLCLAGQYSDAAGSSLCEMCANGTVLIATGSDDSNDCIACPEGTSSPEPTIECVDCPPGQYSEVEGSSACELCSFGTSLVTTGASSLDACEDCAPGRFSVNPAASCVDCWAGRYSDEAGAAACTYCEAGKVLGMSGSSSEDDCVDCAAGQFSMNPAIDCELCGLGKYADQGQSECTSCVMGRFRIIPGGDSQDVCQECSPGKFGTNQTVECEDCEAGRFIASAGQTDCQDCPRGTASNRTGNHLESLCLSCAPGLYMPVSGAMNCLACAVGTDATESGSTECVDCVRGRYAGEPGTTSCLPCPLGRYARAEAATDCEWCPQGEETPDVGMLQADNCTACASGRFLESDTTVTDLNRQGQCVDCASGTHTNGRDRQVECDPCPLGTYSGVGNPTCTDCPIGQLTPWPNPDPDQPFVQDRCELCPDGKGTVLQQGLSGLTSVVCQDCPPGYYFFAADPDNRYQDPVSGQADVWQPPDLDDPTLDAGLSCRRCPPGEHTFGSVTAEPCTRCPADPPGKASDFVCQGGSCKAGHDDTPGGFCGSCISLDDDEQSGNCGDNGQPCGGDGEDPCGELGPYRKTCGYFAKGFECVECSDPILVAGLGLTGLTIATSTLTWAIVKGFSSDDVGRIQGGMDFTKAITATFGMFQRLTAILTLPFGWPSWLVELCYYLKGIVAFDLPGLAAPECNAAQTAAEMQLTRLAVSAFALPVVWLLIFIEMIVIRNCSKMGKRKAERGTSLFGCTLFGFGKCGCPEGAFQSVVVTMHGLFFLNVIQSAFGALNCQPFSDGKGSTRMALAINPAVYCELEVGENWDENDVVAFATIRATAYFMVCFYGFFMSFLHWDVKVEYVGIWNKAFVSAIVIFFGREEDALTALLFLSGVSTFFALLGNRWKRMLDQDGDDSNDAEEDAFFCMEVGCYCEMMTYVFGITLVQGYEIEPGQVGIQVSWYSWGNVAAYTILAVMTIYAIWTFKLGIQDEIAARRAEKAAVAHILFREMDADCSGKLDFNELHELCERLGQKKSDKEITQALQTMDKDGDMQADADEFVDWWIHNGGRKVPIPDEFMELAEMAGGRGARRGNPFHSAADFQVDDEVRWFKEDEDVPHGSIGHVVGFKPKSGGSWKSGDLGLGPKVFVNNRVYVAWPSRCCFAHEPAELLLYSGKRTVPVGANWRGVFPGAAEREQADTDDAEAFDRDAEPKAVGKDEPLASDAIEADGQSSFAVDGPTEEVDVQFDFLVGDHVVVKDGCTIDGIPKQGDIGAVTGFTNKLVARVLFASSEVVFEVNPTDLELEVAKADNTIAQAWAHVSVETAALATEQTEADQDHATLLEELGEMNEKTLKKRLAKLYPNSGATKIDKTQGNGVDDRIATESKSDWRRRILYDHSVEIAEQEKSELDAVLAQKMADAIERKESIRIDYEHLTHQNAVGVHDARIAHAEKMHKEIVQQHDEDLKKVQQRKHWNLRAGKARKKTEHVMREEAESRGIDTNGMKKKHVKKAIIKHQQEQGEARKQEQLNRIDAERARHADSRSNHDGFISKHGLHGADPGSVSGLIKTFESDDGSQGAAREMDFTEFENPVAQTSEPV